MRKTYHREDLRRELVEAALDHVLAHGHDDLSIRKLAQLVDVSSGAPYHHFADRRAVLIAVAEKAFQALRLEIERRTGQETNPRSRLEAASNAFFDFAEARVNLFDLMFDSELTRPLLDPQIEEQYRLTYLPILADFTAFLKGGDDPVVRVQLYWSTIFGFAFLTGRDMRGGFSASGLDAATLRSRVTAAAIGREHFRA